ncbi:hypothetical protein BaRGS_00030514 [Batillaria attramentaria]|uniref:Uncharacterized protein n=1 Tax=Batillaria attramentaria TaxID=370345 RepID=A0ABD0JU03_9CAEN
MQINDLWWKRLDNLWCTAKDKTEADASGSVLTLPQTRPHSKPWLIKHPHTTASLSLPYRGDNLISWCHPCVVCLTISCSWCSACISRISLTHQVIPAIVVALK